MTYVVTKPCLGTKDRSCVEVCPVDCFYDIRDRKLNETYGVSVSDDSGDANDPKIGMLMIHPDQCINCGACETECPTEAIYEDSAVPPEHQDFVKLNESVTMSMSDEELEKCNCTEKIKT